MLEVPSAGGVAIGITDEPLLQRQVPTEIDLAHDGSVLVYGASGSGKTTFLRTVAVSLASTRGAERVNIYGLDFATRGLAGLEALPHVGGVIPGDDRPRVERLFTMLKSEITRRKEASARGEEAVEPRIVVLLDNYAGFAGAFERVDFGRLVEELPHFVADGRPLGIHLLITADRRGAVPGTLAGIIARKIVLRMADEDEYAALGLATRTVKETFLPPGRGFLEGAVEFQCAIPGRDPSPEGQRRAIRELAERIPPAPAAPEVLLLPAFVDRSSLPRPSGPFRAVVGLDEATLTPIELSLADGHALVVGPYGSGRSTALGTLASSLMSFFPDAAFHLLAPRRTPLAEVQAWAEVHAGVDACNEAIRRLADEPSFPSGPAFVVVDDGEELLEASSALDLEALVRKTRDAPVRVLAAVERGALQRAFGGWTAEIRKSKSGILLDPDLDVDGDLFGVRLPKRSTLAFPPGRGFLVARGTLHVVQVASGRYGSGEL